MTDENQIFENLNELGNMEGDLPDREIVSNGHLICPNVILKQYVMFEDDQVEKYTASNVFEFYNFVKEKFEIGEIPAFSGLGFLIISNGILNVCRWSDECIDVIVPKLYIIGDDKKSLINQNIEEVGAFCSGEKRVYDHENKAWLKYLKSPRENKDKMVYLNDFLKK